MDYIDFDMETLSLEELKALIRHHDAAYDAGTPEIADVRYDALMRELAKRAPEDELLSALHSMEVSATGKVTHKVPMLSLNKAYSLAEVMTWAAASPGKTSPTNPRWWNWRPKTTPANPTGRPAARS